MFNKDRGQFANAFQHEGVPTPLNQGYKITFWAFRPSGSSSAFEMVTLLFLPHVPKGARDDRPRSRPKHQTPGRRDWGYSHLENAGFPSARTNALRNDRGAIELAWTFGGRFRTRIRQMFHGDTIARLQRQIRMRGTGGSVAHPIDIPTIRNPHVGTYLQGRSSLAFGICKDPRSWIPFPRARGTVCFFLPIIGSLTRTQTDQCYLDPYLLPAIFFYIFT